MTEEIDLEDMEEEAAEEEEEVTEEPKETSEAKPRERTRSKKYELYEMDGDDLKRKNKACPRCGPGIFMADHGDRLACGKCGYTEFKQKS